MLPIPELTLALRDQATKTGMFGRDTEEIIAHLEKFQTTIDAIDSLDFRPTWFNTMTVLLPKHMAGALHMAMDRYTGPPGMNIDLEKYVMGARCEERFVREWLKSGGE